MFYTLSLAAATTPSGDPTLRPGLDPSSVTPGLPGFLATLFIVVVVIFLIRDMVKRVRRVRYTAEVEEARAERSEASAGPHGGQGAEPDVRLHRTVHDGDAPGTEGPDRPRPGGKHGPDNR